MRPDDAKRIVEQGYDQIAEAYLAGKADLDFDTNTTGTSLGDLLARLPAGARVLDLGCGPGVPVTQCLAEKCETVGVDISARQLELARQHVPTAQFLKADMTAVEFAPGSFQAVVSYYAIIHVPREEQSALIARIYSWLRPGCYFLANWATEAWEAVDEFDGAPMWWSHYDPETSLGFLRDAGFVIVYDELRTDDEDTWRWVLARKP